MLFQDRFGFPWEKTLVCVGTPALPPTVCQPQRQTPRHVGATDFSPNGHASSARWVSHGVLGQESDRRAGS